MAHSSKNTVRGYLPPQNDEEKILMRHIADMASVAQKRDICRYSDFLNDRQQILAQAALSAFSDISFYFHGGFDDAERKVLCIEPSFSEKSPPLGLIVCKNKLGTKGKQPTHKDYLGTLMGLSFERACLGDIVISTEDIGTAYIFALDSIIPIILDEIREVGRVPVTLEYVNLEDFPAQQLIKRELKTATIASLRLDAVLAAMLHVSRGQAASFISSGNVEINHIEANSVSQPIYEGDIFTIRRKGRFKLVSLLGKSRKDKQIIEYFQF